MATAYQEYMGKRNPPALAGGVALHGEARDD